MKYKKSLFLLVTPLLMGSVTTKAVVQTMTISSPRYGPYEVYQDDVSTEFAVLSTVSDKTVIYEKVIFKDMKTNQSRTVTCAEHTIKFLSTAKIPITIPTSQFFGSGGMRITITVYRSSDDYKYNSVNCVIYPSEAKTVKALDYLNTGYTTKTTAVSFPNKLYNEKFIFHNIADYFLTDIYYRMPIDLFEIEVVTQYPDLETGTGIMVIEDNNNLFSNFKSFQGLIMIPIELKKDGDFYKVFITKTLYVNPKNLYMSDTPISGYVATRNFYYPVNQVDDYQGLTVGFNIMQFGYSKTNLTWSSTCYSSSSFIGACSNSEYCVVGEVSK